MPNAADDLSMYHDPMDPGFPDRGSPTDMENYLRSRKAKGLLNPTAALARIAQLEALLQSPPTWAMSPVLDNDGSKLYRIQGYELLEADGIGVRDNRVALISSEKEAQKWVDGSKGYRRYRPYNETIVVHANLESLAARDREELKQKALSKLSAAEREALGF